MLCAHTDVRSPIGAEINYSILAFLNDIRSSVKYYVMIMLCYDTIHITKRQSTVCMSLMDQVTSKGSLHTIQVRTRCSKIGFDVREFLLSSECFNV